MPDLSHRPTRYLCAAATAAALGAASVSTLDVRLGPDPALEGAAERAAVLEAQVAELQAELADADREGTADVPTVDLVDDGGERGSVAPTCAEFPDRETAQVAFDADGLALADLDGDGDGLACEQLKSRETARAWGGTAPPAPTSAPPSPRAPVTAPMVAAPATTTTTSPAPGPPPVDLPIAPSKAEIVASTGHFGMAAPTTEEYDRIEWRLATDTTIRSFYTGFDTDYDRDRVIASWRRGEIPMLTWESRPLAGLGVDVDASLERIASGALDDYLVRYASDIADLGLPVVIRFDHEMNGGWYRWSEVEPAYGNAPGSYVAAWRHVHDVFDAVGANDQVIWVWSPNRVDNIGDLPSIDRYWPGSDYVDWVGMTGYMRPSDVPADFGETYDATLDELRRVAPGTPILLTEVGATELGGAKLEFVESFFPGLAANPDVIGFVWFQYAVSEDGTTNDWRIDSTAAVFDAFRAGLRASPFGVVWRDGQPDTPTTTSTPTTTVPPSTTTSTSTTVPASTTTTPPVEPVARALVSPDPPEAPADATPSSTTTTPTTTADRDAATDPTVDAPDSPSEPAAGGAE